MLRYKLASHADVLRLVTRSSLMAFTGIRQNTDPLLTRY